MRSIRFKIIAGICAILTISMLTIASTAIMLNSQTTKGVLEQSMLEAAKLAADSVTNKLDMFMRAAAEVGYNPILSDPNATHEQIQAVLDETCAHYPDFTRGSTIGTDGIGVLNGNDYNEREYFKQSMQGKTWISDPLIAKTTGAVSIIVSAPIWKDGIKGGTVDGVLFFVPTETMLNDIVSTIKISPNGSAYMLNKSGTTIAHKNMDNVKNMENTQEDAKADGSLAELASLEKRMMTGASGFGFYEYGGVEKYLSFAPIRGTDGWSIAVNAPVNDFMQYTYAGIQQTAIALALALIVGVIVAGSIASSISRPVRLCSQRLTLLANGDLKSPVPPTRRKDEIGVLQTDLARCVTTMDSMLGDVSYILHEMARGNLDVSVNGEYPGDFEGMKESLQTIIDSFNSIMGDISTATTRVSDSTQQISMVSQSLAQNNTQQAGTLSQFSASVSHIRTQAEDSANLSQLTKNEIFEAGSHMDKSIAKMEEMRRAMQLINKSSQEMVGVIKAIDDIAFQTNILALNASVEAARAGQYGKGFAVVAEEVRDLASKSSDAAKETANLIQASVSHVRLGLVTANETAESIEMAANIARESITAMDKLSVMSRRQATAITQIDEDIEKISSAVQENSASSQESAAAAQEMNAQGIMLKDVVKRFKTRYYD